MSWPGAGVPQTARARPRPGCACRCWTARACPRRRARPTRRPSTSTSAIATGCPRWACAAGRSHPAQTRPACARPPGTRRGSSCSATRRMAAPTPGSAAARARGCGPCRRRWPPSSAMRASASCVTSVRMSRPSSASSAPPRRGCPSTCGGSSAQNRRTTRITSRPSCAGAGLTGAASSRRPGCSRRARPRRTSTTPVTAPGWAAPSARTCAA